MQWRGLDGLKHNACTGIIPRQKSHWPMNRHLNSKGQEWKPGYTKKREKVKAESKEGEYGCTFYTRMNTEYLNLLKSP
jgi:hypothetical protein